MNSKSANCTETAQQIVAKQAADESLWFEAQTAPEAYLQAALRALHDAVENAALASPAHTDHPLRHFDRTCPACLAEGEQNAAPQGTTPNDRA